jgi:hypothetical protein
MRGRVFATLFALMRIGLFVAMAIAVPLRAAFGRLDVAWLFSQPTRTVLFLGGMVMIAAGFGVLWSQRGLLRGTRMGEETRYIFEEASRARRFPYGDGDGEDEDES